MLNTFALKLADEQFHPEFIGLYIYIYNIYI